MDEAKQLRYQIVIRQQFIDSPEPKFAELRRNRWV